MKRSHSQKLAAKAPETNRALEKIAFQKEIVFCNHPFSGALAVSFRECIFWGDLGGFFERGSF